jgi:linoleoyl-CoA desaturase
VPHTHYARIAEIVRRNAEAHGVRYTSHPTLRAALRSHVRHLRAMGREGTPVQLELG